MNRRIFKILGLSLLWVILFDIIHLQLDPVYSLFLNGILAFVLGIVASKYLKSIFDIILFLSFIIAVSVLFLVVGSAGLVYLPIVTLLVFLGTYAVCKKGGHRVLYVLILFAVYFISFQCLPQYFMNSEDSLNKIDFKIQDYSMTTNSGLQINKLDNKVKIFEFWNKGCGSCFRKMRMLKELKAELGDKCEIVCVYADMKKTNKNSVQYFEDNADSFSKKYDLEFAYDSVHYFYNTKQGVPQTFIVQPDGKILRSDAGYSEFMKDETKKKYKEIILDYYKK